MIPWLTFIFTAFEISNGWQGLNDYENWQMPVPLLLFFFSLANLFWSSGALHFAYKSRSSYFKSGYCCSALPVATTTTFLHWTEGIWSPLFIFAWYLGRFVSPWLQYHFFFVRFQGVSTLTPSFYVIFYHFIFHLPSFCSNAQTVVSSCVFVTLQG